MPEAWLDDCLARLITCRAAVFGDLCLYAYWLIDPEESELSE